MAWAECVPRGTTILSANKNLTTMENERNRFPAILVLLLLAILIGIVVMIHKNTSKEEASKQEVYADSVKVWEGNTPKALSYIHIPLKNAPKAKTYKTV